MKKLLVLVFVSLFLGSVKAQFVKSSKTTTKQNWQNLAIEQDGVYGAEIDKANNFLKDKKVKKKVIVALIGTGLDVDHPDLQASIWNNPNEKLNQKDDNNNGLVDDLHGWNFLGNSKGEALTKLSLQADRDFLRLKDKDNYGSLFNDNGQFKIFDEISKQLVNVNPPKDMEEYNFFKNEVSTTSDIAAKAFGVEFQKYSQTVLGWLYNDLKTKNPDINQLNIADIGKQYDLNALDSIQKTAIFIFSLTQQYLPKNWTLSQRFEWVIGKEYMEKAQSQYDEALKLVQDAETRGMVGDDPLNINDRIYGNGILKTDDSRISTMSAGIIGATHNTIGINGIASEVEIMGLRVETDELYGSPFSKDIALAIRYAVDNGADIIQMPKTTSLLGKDEYQWLKDAMVYAEEKGVLLVASAWDFPYDYSVKKYYPNKYISDKHTLNNFICVAASDPQGNPLQNTAFGKDYLDVYAPGMDIYSTYLGGTYRTESNSRLAAAMVTGVAALIKNYYPELNGNQIKDLILNNVTSRNDVEIEKTFYVIRDNKPQSEKKDIIAFETLCASTGILNAYQAILAADKMVKNN